MKQILANQANVLHALILRAIQTRFGGKHVNFLIALCWPLGHILLLLAIYSLMGRAAPIGASTVMFFATGLTPYMFFNYPSRFMMMGAIMNKPLLSFPVVKLTDLIIASAILETVAGFAVITVTASVLYCIGEHVWPQDPGMALGALGGMWVFAMGYGLFCSVLAMVNSVLPIATALIQIIFYLTSGILFIPAALPERAQQILWWNPTAHGVQWFRESYFGDAMATEYFPNITYLVGSGLILMLIALVIERFVVRKRVN